MCRQGIYNGFLWNIKIDNEDNKFGIDNGRISKLRIQRKQHNEEVANYDRGWDIKPFDDNGNFYSDDVREVYEYLTGLYN